jgi:hypothetical protein
MKHQKHQQTPNRFHCLGFRIHSLAALLFYGIIWQKNDDKLTQSDGTQIAELGSRIFIYRDALPREQFFGDFSFSFPYSCFKGCVSSDSFVVYWLLSNGFKSLGRNIPHFSWNAEQFIISSSRRGEGEDFPPRQEEILMS